MRIIVPYLDLQRVSYRQDWYLSWHWSITDNFIAWDTHMSLLCRWIYTELIISNIMKLIITIDRNSSTHSSPMIQSCYSWYPIAPIGSLVEHYKQCYSNVPPEDTVDVIGLTYLTVGNPPYAYVVARGVGVCALAAVCWLRNDGLRRSLLLLLLLIRGGGSVVEIATTLHTSCHCHRHNNCHLHYCRVFQSMSVKHGYYYLCK